MGRAKIVVVFGKPRPFGNPYPYGGVRVYAYIPKVSPSITSAADIVFILKDKPHARFMREGHNLIFRPDIPLVKVFFLSPTHMHTHTHTHTHSDTLKLCTYLNHIACM